MNELQKLIDLYDSRPENLALHPNLRTYARDNRGGFTGAFALFLASRPTCTATGRMFLDEIREKGRWSEDDENLAMEGLITFPDGDTTIWQPDFKTPLKELVK